FLKRIDKRYDKKIQNIFLILDNLSAHKSKMVKEEASKRCTRIKFVFLTARTPHLNLIEVEDGCGYKGRLQSIILYSNMTKK
ncbi:MAG TPA: transposase, partial [Candidatus Sulfopaludibacter sp.]|nr:transposase [Candidatus Sulfopaludibacter sp.]